MPRSLRASRMGNGYVGVNIGSLNRRLTLQSRNNTTGAYSAVDTVWGSLSFVGGTAEALIAGAALAIAQWLVVIRYRSDVKAEWVIVDGETSRVFQITSYGDPDGHKRVLQLSCSEVQ